MIEIKCLEKGKKNSYSIRTISLWRRDKNHYIGFQFEDKGKADHFFENMKLYLSVYLGEAGRLDFLLIEQQEFQNIVVMKGNIADLILKLGQEEILQSSNLSIFYDDEEEEIQGFLKSSQKVDGKPVVYRGDLSVKEKGSFNEEQSTLPKCNIL